VIQRGHKRKNNIKIWVRSLDKLDWAAGWQIMPRKHIVRVVLSPQQRELLDKICHKLGQSESETMRIAFLEYAKSISLITEKVHS
jgi:hypothetical protein